MTERKAPTVLEMVEFKSRVKMIADDPENKNSMEGIIATRCALDLDHLARIISRPAIDVGQFWIQVTPKHKKDHKKFRKTMREMKRKAG